MKRVYKILLLVFYILFSNFSYSQSTVDKNIQSSENTIINDGQNLLHPQKEVLIKQLEGVDFSYSLSDNNSNCIFHIKNSSNNSIKIIWDVKLFFSNENDSKEIHKELIILPQTDVKINTIENNISSIISESSKTKSINNIEIHNVSFKGVMQ